MSKSFQEEELHKKTLRVRKLLSKLPDFMSEYIRGKSETTSINTRIVYIYDLRIFLIFLIENFKEFGQKDLKTFNLDDLNKVNYDHIEAFMEYITYYTTENENGEAIERQNKERGKSRKLAAIRALFKYFYKKRKLNNNYAELVDMPKLHNKNIIKLEKNEMTKLIKAVDKGNELTKKEKSFHKYTRDRDMAIIILLLGTGIRVSECVGINIQDVDFNIGGIKIIRKGGDEAIIYFGKEVKKALLDYLEVRNEISPLKGNEDALFLSLQNKRITTRAVQNLVKKYSNLIGTLKKVSPHKLRSTYGTNLYQATGDIYLVADVLGHKDINTTRKHYVKMDEERRKQAVNFVKLNEDDE